MQVAEDSLLVAELVENKSAGKTFKSLSFRCLAGTWRHKNSLMEIVSLGRLLAYLNAIGATDSLPEEAPEKRRVIDRVDVNQLTLFSENVT